jgi:hypothetical protein
MMKYYSLNSLAFWRSVPANIALLVGTLGAGGCREALGFWMGTQDLETRFRSPSGVSEILVKEYCLGFACYQRAYLDGFWDDRFLGELEVGDPERYVFQGAIVEWSKDESQMHWQVKMRHGIKTGTIVIPVAVRRSQS